MLTSRLASAKRLGKKALNVAPIVTSNPKLLSLMRQGVHPEIYNRLNGAWLTQGKIRTVLDIGANTGQFSHTVHALLPDATIYAFEPQADCFEAIQQGFMSSPNLHVIQTAIGDDDGEITFHTNNFSQSSSVLKLTDLHKEAFPWATESGEIQVPIRRLDSLQTELDLTSSILVKIDVQGYEDRVLLGGGEVIHKAEIVLIETAFEPLYQGEASFSVVYDLMIGYGFRYAGNLDQITNPSNDRPLYADALFLKNR